MSTKNKVIKSFNIVFWSFAQIISFLFSVFVLYLIYAMLGMSIPYQEQLNAKGPTQKIYVRSNGVHTDICFQIVNEHFDWWSFFDKKDYPLARYQWVAMGWGDEAFFIETETWDDLKLGTTLSSVFLPTDAAMHVEMLRLEPDESERCVMLEIPAENYLTLQEYARSSFKLNGSNPNIIEDASYFGNDRFYKAKGKYHWFETCNSWTNKGLKTAGIRTMSWAIFPKSLMSFHKN